MLLPEWPLTTLSALPERVLSVRSHPLAIMRPAAVATCAAAPRSCRAARAGVRSRPGARGCGRRARLRGDAKREVALPRRSDARFLSPKPPANGLELRAFGRPRRERRRAWTAV